MNNLLKTLKKIFGSSESSPSEPQVQTVDPNTIRYSMPTISEDQPSYTMPTQEAFEGAPQFHEDEWRQLEFFPMIRLPEIKRILQEYKPFEQANRGQYGWNKIYIRELENGLVITGKDSPAYLANLFGVPQSNSPILTTSSSPLGQVQDGFSIPLAEKINLYGQTNESGISVLGLVLDSGANDQTIAQAFIKLNSTHNLIFVDWRSQLVLTASHENGDIDVWRP